MKRLIFKAVLLLSFLPAKWDGIRSFYLRLAPDSLSTGDPQGRSSPLCLYSGPNRIRLIRKRLR